MIPQTGWFASSGRIPTAIHRGGKILTDVDGQSAESDSVSNPESEANTTNGAETASEAEPVIESSVTKTYDYFYLGDKLGRMTITTTVDDGAPATETIDFFYDSNGTPYALKYNNTLYYYITNLQGDVMSIVDGSGKPVAEYSYDPYGNVLTATGTLAEVNPLRYRGYYYDTESQLYYLQSRYYDPELGRFINADAFVSTGQGLLGNNMFAYCNNNPATYYDPTGTKREFWYQMYQDHDPGYVHRAVQVHILVTGNAEAIIYNSEYYMPGIGFADIVCLETEEMWEIKHGGSDDEGWNNGINNAVDRLTKYLSNGCTLKKGSANQFSGTFVISVGSINYLVTYSTPEAGVILYTFERANSTKTVPTFSYAPHTLYEEQKNAMLAGVMVFAFVGCPGGSPSERDYACYMGG